MRSWAVVFLLLFCLSVQAQPKRHFVPDPHLREALRRAELMTGDSLDEATFQRGHTIYLHTDSIRNWEGWQYFDQVQNLSISLYQIHIDSGFHWPKGLVDLTINQADVPVLKDLPVGLRHLVIKRSCITRLEKLPAKLRTLIMENRESVDRGYADSVKEIEVHELPPLPKGLKYLRLIFLNVKAIPTFPDSLAVLSIVDCPLKELASLPRSLRELELGFVNLSHLPELPPFLYSLTVYACSLKHLPALPPRLLYFNYARSTFPIEELPIRQQHVNCQYFGENCLVTSQRPLGIDSIYTLPITRIDSISVTYDIYPVLKKGTNELVRYQESKMHDSFPSKYVFGIPSRGPFIRQIYKPIANLLYSTGYRYHRFPQRWDSAVFIPQQAVCEFDAILPLLRHYQKLEPEFYFDEISSSNPVCPYLEEYSPGVNGQCGLSIWNHPPDRWITVFTNAGNFRFEINIVDAPTSSGTVSNDQVRDRAAWLYSYQIVNILRPPYLSRNPYTLSNLKAVAEECSGQYLPRPPKR